MASLKNKTSKLERLVLYYHAKFFQQLMCSMRHSWIYNNQCTTYTHLEFSNFDGCFQTTIFSYPEGGIYPIIQCFPNLFFWRNTVTIQNLVHLPYHNAKYVHIPLGTTNISAYFLDTSLPGCVNANQHNNGAVKSSNLAIATFLFNAMKSVIVFQQWNSILVFIHSLVFSP